MSDPRYNGGVPYLGRVPEGEIRTMPDGSIKVGTPAAVAAAQAPPPAGQQGIHQPVAQVTINVPLSKLSAFMKMVEEWMTDEDWQKKQAGI